MSKSNRTVHSEAMGLMRLFENLMRARGWVKSKPSVSEARTWYSLLEGEVIGVLWSSEALYGAQKVRGPEKTWRTVHHLLGRHNKWAKDQAVARNDTNTSARALHYMMQTHITQLTQAPHLQ
jgi:hypothetical protein